LVKTKIFFLDAKISKKQKIRRRHYFSLRKINSLKTRFVLNQNRSRYVILVKTKKFRHNVTVSKNNKEQKKAIFSEYGKVLAEKQDLFQIETVKNIKFW